jgi:hypothetical protein
MHYVLRSTSLLIVFGIRKICQSSGRNPLFYLFIRRAIKLTAVANYRGISLLSAKYKMLPNILLSRLTPYIDEIIGYYQC